MKKEDFVFYKIPTGAYSYYNLRGKKSTQMGFIYKHLTMNTFSNHLTAVPPNAELIQTPSDEWLKEFFYDENKTQIILDRLIKPENARGKYYPIIDNGGTTFYTYVNSNGVFVYRIPTDGYVGIDLELDKDNQHLIYTQLVWSCQKPIDVFIGKDSHIEGNSILVHIQDTEYVFIGWDIYSFTTDEKITDYYSYIGNSCVSYPVAVSQDSLFFMLDYKKISIKKHLNSKIISKGDFGNAYEFFFDLEENQSRDFDDYKLIVERD